MFHVVGDSINDHKHLSSHWLDKQLNWTDKIFSEFLCKATEILENLHSFELKLIFISVLKTQYLNYGRMKGLMKKLQWADGEWRIYS